MAPQNGRSKTHPIPPPIFPGFAVNHRVDPNRAVYHDLENCNAMNRRSFSTWQPVIYGSCSDYLTFGGTVSTFCERFIPATRGGANSHGWFRPKPDLLLRNRQRRLFNGKCATSIDTQGGSGNDQKVAPDKQREGFSCGHSRFASFPYSAAFTSPSHALRRTRRRIRRSRSAC